MIVSRILYAQPAWGACLTVDLIDKIDAHSRKAVRLARLGYNSNLKLPELLQDMDIKLYRIMKHSTHCIHQFLKS